MKLQRQVAVVTGAGRGIGRAIADNCAQAGAKVALVARSAEELDVVAREIAANGGTTLAYPTDITDYSAVQTMVQEIETSLGPIDLLINNAGRFACIGPTWEIDPENWWQDVTVNIQGLFHCCRAVLPGMVSRRAGRIINLIGGGVDAPFPYGTGYAVSKAGVMRLTESLAAELKSYNISVFALRPGLVRTAMTAFQIESAEGKRWFPEITKRFDAGEDVSPSWAANLAVQLGSGRFDQLTGRAIRATEDLGTIEHEIATIIAEDLRTLRMR